MFVSIFVLQNEPSRLGHFVLRTLQGRGVYYSVQWEKDT